MNSNYDALDLNKISQNPFCDHGPTVLFKDRQKLFYACSACRDHKLCNFYLKHDEGKIIPKEKYDFWLEKFKSTLIPLEEQKKRRKELFESEDRKYCQTCNEFIFNSVSPKEHKEHLILKSIDKEMLCKPLQKILYPIEKNSSNAQFIFDDQTSNFIIEHINKFEYDSVLCIGTPSIFENLKDLDVNRMLLDIDDRFMMFYDENHYQKFNMFNNFFFYDRKKYETFLKLAKNLLILIDPPYGGLVKLISNTINLIIEDLKDNANKPSIFLFYPYFMESWIKIWLPEFRMLDYKVSYGNQKKFSISDAVKKGSPARIFTNISLKNIQLPVEQGYHFCDLCSKYTFDENIHCNKCNICPSKDGFYYKHCKQCERCVKSAYDHCKNCKKCHLKETCPLDQSQRLKRKKSKNIIKKKFKK